MTRKHFNAFAKALLTISDTYQRAQAAALIADICKAANPNFDRARFMEACGL